MHKNFLRGASLLALSAFCPLNVANANPEDGVVSAGSATIQEQGKKLNIHQNSDRVVIDWRSFDIKADEHTEFYQPSGSSVALNRVNSVNPSNILGRLSANGNVILINPNGVFFGKDSVVDVNGLVATTSDIDNNKFMSGDMTFDKSGKADASVVNEGTITAREAGLVGLIAPNVENRGVIKAKLGKVQMSSGDSFTVDLYGNQLYGIKVSDEVRSQIVRNSGSIVAEGGEIAVTAAQGKNIVNSLVTIQGELKTASVSQKGGKIIIGEGHESIALGGIIAADGTEGGSVAIKAQALSLAETISAKGLSGKGGSITIDVSKDTIETSSSTLDVSGKNDGGTIRHVAGGKVMTSGHYIANSADGSGGNIDISGKNMVALSASFDASGADGGGRIRVGGEYQGGKNLIDDELKNSHTITLNNTTSMKARGTGSSANGGSVIIWSDQNTLAAGSIDVSQSGSGQGGMVEISSGDKVYYQANVTTGVGGTFLLDPKNILIDNASSSVMGAVYTAIGEGYGDDYFGIDLDLSSSDQFGSSASLDGTRLAVGAIGDDGFNNTSSGVGGVYLFSFTDSEFNGAVLEGMIGENYVGGKNIHVDLDTFDEFGGSVSLNGNQLVVGAGGGDGFNNLASATGEVYLFSFTDSVFSGGTLESMIGEGYTGGKNININLDSFDIFGADVSLDSNRLGIGATGGRGFNNTGASSGEVYIFSFSDSTFNGGNLEAMIGENYAGGKNINLDLDGGDNFGSSLSLNGNRLAIGATDGDGFNNTATNTGEVYLFSFSDSVFSGGTLQAMIGENYAGAKDININLDSSDVFASSISLDGNRLAIGATGGDGFNNTAAGTGEVYLFSFSDSVFSGGTLEAMIGEGYAGAKDININIDGSDAFGAGVSLNGNRLVSAGNSAGGFLNSISQSGETYFFTFDDAVFSGGEVKGYAGVNYKTTKGVYDINLDSNDNFGRAVSLDGERLAIGSPAGSGFNNTGNSAGGEVYLFSFSDEDFNGAVLQSMIGANYVGGKNISISFDSSDTFGTTLSLDGNRLAVGATGGDGFNNTASGTGEVYLFSFSDSVFSGGTLEAMIGEGYTGGKNININLDTGDTFGSGVSLDGNRLAIGSTGGDGFNNTASATGELYLFSFSDSVFSGGTLQATIGENYVGAKDININLDSSDAFASSISLNGNRLAVGATGGDGFNNTASSTGEVYLFSFSDSVFSGGALQAMVGENYVGAKDININLDASDLFGSSVSLDGNNLMIGATGGDGFNNTGSGTGEAFLFAYSDSDFNSGALASSIGWGYVGTNDFDLSVLLSNNDFFGSSVSLDGSRLAIGAHGADGHRDLAGGTGDVYLFDYDSGGNDPVTDGDAFADRIADNITITVADILALLNAGTAVTLQASNDITLAQNLIAANGSGNGGTLTFQAGRSILLNANIGTDNGNLNLYANERALTGVVDAQRDAGNAVITMAVGTSINAGTGSVNLRIHDGQGNTNNSAGDMTLRGITAGSIFAQTFGTNSSIITESGILTASGTGSAIQLVSSKNYINNAGAGALSTASGRWLIYSTNVTDSVDEELLSYGFRRYGCTYSGGCSAGVTIPGTGNGLIYSFTPTLTITGVTASNKVYDAATMAILNNGSAALSGVISGDTVTLDSSSATGAFGNKNVGTGKSVTASGYALSGTQLGYALTQPTGLTANITAKGLSITGVTASNKVYDGATAATLNNGSAALSGVVIGDTVTLDGSSSSGVFGNKNVGTGKAVTASGYTIGGGDSGNYSLAQPTGVTANITAKGLTITGVTASNKVYDGTTAATLNNGSAALSGVVIGDTVTLGTGSSSGVFGNNSVGVGKAVTASGYTIGGGDSANYTLSQPAGLTANVTVKSLNVAANNLGKAQGGVDPVFTYNASGLVGGDSLIGSLTRDPGEAVGTYNINQGSLLASANYSLIFAPGIFTISASGGGGGGNNSSGGNGNSNVFGPVSDTVRDALSNRDGISIFYTVGGGNFIVPTTVDVETKRISGNEPTDSVSQEDNGSVVNDESNSPRESYAPIRVFGGLIEISPSLAELLGLKETKIF